MPARSPLSPVACSLRRLALAFFVWLALTVFHEHAVAQMRAFPGAEGWAAMTPAGRGGRIVRVTTLAARGPGSFAEAVSTPGPRIVVFEVGGVIDLERQTLKIREPFLTIAGQTAPAPGITFIRGALSIQTHDVVVRHIRVRTGEAGHEKRGGWQVDGLECGAGARDVIVDQCSFAWATDENLSVWGDPFAGDSPEQWHEANPRRITLSRNIIAEGLSDSTHPKGPHSKGALIGDNCTYVLVLENLFASNVERNPQLKGGTWSAVVNNLIYNPGVTSVHYHMTDLWKDRPKVSGRLELTGNVMRHGPDTIAKLALFRFGGSGNLELHAEDNLAFNRAGEPMPAVFEDKRYGGRIIPPTVRMRPEGLKPLPAVEVEERVLSQAGARPWDRDAVDERIVRLTREGTGRVIHSELDGGGYPSPMPTRQAFNPEEWDLDTMLRRDSRNGG